MKKDGLQKTHQAIAANASFAKNLGAHAKELSERVLQNDEARKKRYASEANAHDQTHRAGVDAKTAAKKAYLADRDGPRLELGG